MKKQYQLNILGQDLSVLSDSGDEHVASTVQYVEAKVQQIKSAAGNLNPFNIAILTALNIADEYVKLRGINEKLSDDLGSRTENLIGMIDAVK